MIYIFFQVNVNVWPQLKLYSYSHPNVNFLKYTLLEMFELYASQEQSNNIDLHLYSIGSGSVFFYGLH